MPAAARRSSSAAAASSPRGGAVRPSGYGVGGEVTTRWTSNGGSVALSTCSTATGGARQRARSVVAGAAQVLSSLPWGSRAPTLLKVVVTTAFDVRVDVSLKGARPDGRGLPTVCAANAAPSEAIFVAALGGGALAGGASKGSKGSVQLEDFEEPVTFLVGHPGGLSYVGENGKNRHTVLHAPPWDWRVAGPKPTEGRACDFELLAGELRLTLRKQTKVELQRCIQLQALREAMQGEDYDTLRAQVTKARMASVDAGQIAQGDARLRELREQGRHVGEGCDKTSVREKMAWASVTSRLGELRVNEPCTASEDCPCNVEVNRDEVLEISDFAVQECLKEFGPDGDRQLFEGLVAAALAVEEGCIWKAGGKLIFSEFGRNQSAVALTRMLCKHGQARCSDMIWKLLKFSESKYQGFVTAIQVNFHSHRGSYHDQHRDIYSVKQAAGPNCTCQFQECTGTVCYSLGSSRRVLLETMTDGISHISACGDNCQGRREHNWLNSGAAMYFNGDWNDSHTHGIPPSEDECGPRISIAFLLAAKPFLLCQA